MAANVKDISERVHCLLRIRYGVEIYNSEILTNHFRDIKVLRRFPQGELHAGQVLKEAVLVLTFPVFPLGSDPGLRLVADSCQVLVDANVL